MARNQAITRRRISLWRRLDVASRWVFPGAMLVFGLFVLGMPFGLPDQAALRPAYAMACVYFWSLYRPASMPAPFVALSGLLLDVLGFSPFGLWAVLLLLLQYVALLARRSLAVQRFLLVWACFAAFATAAATLGWMAQSLFALNALPLWPLLMEILLSIAVYPPLAAFLIRAHRGPAAVELA